MEMNLRMEMQRKGITNKAVSKLIGCTEKSVVNKLNGTTEFTLGEAVKINDNLFPEFTMKYLFIDKPVKPV